MAAWRKCASARRAAFGAPSAAASPPVASAPPESTGADSPTSSAAHRQQPMPVTRRELSALQTASA